MQETLHDHHTTVSISGRSMCNLRFPDDTDLMGGSSSELQDLTNRFVDRAPAYEMEVSTEKRKITINSTNIGVDITMNSQKEVTSFNYLEATLCKDGTCSAEVRLRIALAMAALVRLSRIWRYNTISLANR